MNDKLSVKVQDCGGVTVVAFRDASILDAHTIQRIASDLYDLVEKQGRRKLVLSFADVRFLSSQALGVLLALRQKAQECNATFILAALRGELRKLFKLTSLEKLFSFSETRDEAILALGGTVPPSAPKPAAGPAPQ
jgi:anti-sigma B factor antagonist